MRFHRAELEQAEGDTTCCRCRSRRNGHNSIYEEGSRSLKRKVVKSLDSLSIKISEEDEDVSWAEYLTYKLEKLMYYSRNALFYLLFAASGLFMLILGAIWYWTQWMDDPSVKSGRRLLCLHDEDIAAPDMDSSRLAREGLRRLKDGGGGSGDPGLEFSFFYSLFFAFQVLVSAGYSDTIDGIARVMIYSVTLVFGLIGTSLLIGMITEAFTELVESIRKGELKAIEKNHTLVLGWNEGTVRLVCQIAFLRRQWQMMNESFPRRIFWWTRVPPSTVVAKGTIVVMCRDKSKAEIEQAIAHAFRERGISTRRTRLGCDVVCRQGDPDDVQDLQRVGAQHAAAIVIHSTPGDDAHDSTIRTLLALRFVLYTCRAQPPWDELRVVVETNHRCNVVAAAGFRAPVTGRQVVFVQDLSVHLNGLLFSCLGQRGMAQVQLDLLSFESASVKFRKAKDFHDQGAGLVGCTVMEASFLWENAVLVGVRPAPPRRSTSSLSLPPKRYEAKHEEDQSGLLPGPSYIIRPDDLVLFLCQFSLPRLAKEVVDTEGDDVEMAVVSQKATSKDASGQQTTTILGSNLVALAKARFKAMAELSVLICGWREEWNSAESFFGILSDISADARQGILLHFMCDKSAGDFKALMGEVVKMAQEKQPMIHQELKDLRDAKPGEPAWSMYGTNLRIAFTEGDPASYQALEPVVMEREYNEAVVLPPHALFEKGPLVCDRWVTRVILMLRYFTSAAQPERSPVHIVCENALDATMKLAMLPSDSDEVSHVNEEFVNVHAIRARAMCQVLAYPHMFPVLRDLYSKVPKDPVALLVSAELFDLKGRKFSFKQVCKAVKCLGLGGGSDVCLGFRVREGILHMPPMLSQREEFDSGDLLIVLTRHATTSLGYEEEVRKGKRESQRRERSSAISSDIGAGLQQAWGLRRESGSATSEAFSQVVPARPLRTARQAHVDAPGCLDNDLNEEDI